MLREKIRRWLFPELCEKDKDVEKNEDVENIKDVEKDKDVEKNEDVEKNIYRKLKIAIDVMKSIQERGMKEIESETNCMYFKYPVKKRVYLKNAFRELLDYLDLEMTVYEKGDNKELIPKIEKKMYRYTEEK